MASCNCTCKSVSAFQSISSNKASQHRKGSTHECHRCLLKESTKEDIKKIAALNSCNGTNYRNNPSVLKFLLTPEPRDEAVVTAKENSAWEVNLDEDANSPDMFSRRKLKRKLPTPFDQVNTQEDDSLENGPGVSRAKNAKLEFISDGSSSGYVSIDSAIGNSSKTTKLRNEVYKQQQR